MLRRYQPEGRSLGSLVFLPTLALFLFAGASLAQTHQDTITRANSLSSYGGEVTVGGNDGSASYSYPIALPASRGRFQPSLGLYYSSNGSSGPYGVGWSLPLTFIERGVRGSPADASGDPRPQFWLVSNGSRTALVKFPAGQSTHYRSDVANSYLDLINEIKVDPTSGQPLAQTWRASDAHGNQYIFGLAYNRDGIRCEPPAPWFECVRWYLTQVVDVDGNVVNYEYEQEGTSASVLPTHLRYNAYDPGSPTTTIDYASTIDLEYERDPHPQIEVVAGSLVLHDRRLAQVRINNHGSQGLVTLFTYTMKYEPSAETGRGLVSEIQLTGLNGAAGPRPTTFSYNSRLDSDQRSNYVGLANAALITLPTGPALSCRLPQTTLSGANLRPAWIDLDGDKRPDLVWSTTRGPSVICWARNVTNVTPAGAATLSFEEPRPIPGSKPFQGIISFDHPTGESPVERSGRTSVITSRLLDINGDGRPDLVWGRGPTCALNNIEVRPAVGSASNAEFSSCSSICMDATAPAADWMRTFRAPFSLSFSSNSGRGSEVLADLVDLTADGIPDFVISTKDDGWHVYPGYQKADESWAFASTFRKFQPTTNASSGSATPIRVVSDKGSTLTDLVDINGDGLLDRVVVTPATAAAGTANWVVEYNTGFGFKTAPSGVPSPWVTGDSAVGAIAQSDSPDPSGEENSSLYRGLLVDLNGDGQTDYVYKPQAGQSGCTGNAPCPFIVSWNEGLGFSGSRYKTTLLIPRLPRRVDDLFPFSVNDKGMFIDANGDGVIDYMLADPNGGTGWFFFAGKTNRDANRADILTSVTTPLLAKTDLHYAPSTVFDTVTPGTAYPVVMRSELSGPALEKSGTDFWYASASVASSWDDPLRPEFLGFEESWSRDITTGIVNHTSWNMVHAFIGMPKLIEQWVSSGGALTAFSPPFSRTVFDWQARVLGSGSGCGAMPKVSDYPVIPFPSSSTHSTIEAGKELSSGTTIRCVAVDEQGNIGEITNRIDTSASSPDNEYTEHTLFNADAICKSCPIEVWTTDQAGTKLTEARFTYDAKGHLNYVERLVSAAGGVPVYEFASKATFNGDGTVASIEQNNQPFPTVKTSLVYDRFKLRVTRTTVSDSSTALITDSTFDPETGRVSFIRGPYLQGSAAPASQRSFAYDSFGRVIAIGREAVNGSVIPRAIAAFEYRDTSSPSAVKSYSFASPLNLVLGATIPDRDDVNLSVSYFDALGRAIQTRQRLASGTPGDPSSQIVQHLDPNRFRVASAVLLDGAGRIRAQLDPFYSSSISFRDYSVPDPELNTPGLHATINNYDRQGRPSCSAYVPIVSSIPKFVDRCVSNFSDNSKYQLATTTSYGIETVAERARPYLFVDTLPPRENVDDGGLHKPIRQYFDASGRLAYTRDVYDNVSHVVYDALGRAIATERRANYTVAVTITSKAEYDALGRIIKQVDPDFGTRIFKYLPSGQLAYSGQNPTNAAPDGVVGVRYLYGSLGRLTEIQHVSASGNSFAVSQFLYDRPFARRSASGPYEYTADRMTAAISDATTIAFGYNEDGAQTRRDQWFDGLPGSNPNSVFRQIGNDGRLLSTTVSLPELPRPITYRTSYDSAGRPVRLDNGAQVYWEAAQPAGTGAYDALGRLRHSQADNGLVTTDQVFSPFTNLSTAEKISLGPHSVKLFALDNIRYVGLNLSGYTDVITGTKYTMEYDRDGWLSRAAAIPSGTPALGQRYDLSFSHFLNKSIVTSDASAPGLDNIERAVDRGQPGTTVDQTYRYDHLTRPVEGVRSIDSVTRSSSGQSLKSDIYAYDSDRGLLISHNGTEEQFNYDAQNRLTQIKRTGDNSERLSYDAFGVLARRVVMSRRAPRSAETTVYYLGADATIVQSKDGRSGPTVSIQPNVHILLGGVRVASAQNTFTPPLGWSQNLLYYHRDRLGSVVATSLGGGKPGASYRYTPYGSAPLVCCWQWESFWRNMAPEKPKAATP